MNKQKQGFVASPISKQEPTIAVLQVLAGVLCCAVLSSFVFHVST